jgi:hypothetical protein
LGNCYRRRRPRGIRRRLLINPKFPVWLNRLGPSLCVRKRDAVPQQSAPCTGRQIVLWIGPDRTAAARGVDPALARTVYGPKSSHSTVSLRWNHPERSSTCSLLYISPGTKSPFAAFRRRVVGRTAGCIVLSRHYFVSQVASLLKFANETTNPQLAAVLIEKAADLKSQVDESSTRPDPSPQTPDVPSER